MSAGFSACEQVGDWLSWGLLRGVSRPAGGGSAGACRGRRGTPGWAWVWGQRGAGWETRACLGERRAPTLDEPRLEEPLLCAQRWNLGGSRGEWPPGRAGLGGRDGLGPMACGGQGLALTAGRGGGPGMARPARS